MFQIILLIAAAYLLLLIPVLALCRAASRGDSQLARQQDRAAQLEATDVYRRAIRRDVSVAVAVYHGAVPAQRVGA